MPQKPLDVVPIPPPPPEQRRRRDARFAGEGERKSRYTLPSALRSASPVGYRARVPLTRDEARAALDLLALPRPTGFTAPLPVPEGELFDECALGVLSARQSTNYRGFRQLTLGPDRQPELQAILARLRDAEGPALPGATYAHVVIGRPYRNPFTMLLTLVGHHKLKSPLTVATRALKKRLQHIDDIPTIGYLPHLHVGILADAMERATVIASAGRRRANVLMRPFAGRATRDNREAIRALEKLCGLTLRQRAAGWRVALVAQIGGALDDERIALDPATARKLGANLMAFRSERIQPGVNQEPAAPPAYQLRQDMDVPDPLIEQVGRAGYNAFEHWTGLDRERAKHRLLLDRVDVLTPDGKARLRAIRGELEAITDRVVAEMPPWADLPTGKAFSRNAERGRKAFALVGQRIYIGGLSQREMAAEGIDWHQAIRAFGAAAARSALVAELMGTVELPPDCDLLAGICLMAGPVNQNDIGKQFYGYPDLLAHAYGDRDPTSLLVWTLKAKTVADPIGNEEQLMNAARKGALVDLRPAPHEIITLERHGRRAPMRPDGSEERAFGEIGNFVTDPDGKPIEGNAGHRWPGRDEAVW
ncbi:MAG: hypothetical protein R3F65_24820 [bacterium]